jgi:starch synthase
MVNQGANRQKKILYLTAESSPYSKVGGLGDVSGSLPPILAKMYPDLFDIRMVMPYHSNIDLSSATVEKVDEFETEYANTHEYVSIFQDVKAAYPVYFLKSQSLSNTPPYTENNQVDLIKYALFSKAVHQFCRVINFEPDVYHANDWHTALSVYLTKTRVFRKTHSKPFSTIMAIHNLPYMGNSNRKILRKFGYRISTNLSLPKWARDLPLPMGISRADRILTVSNGYAQEIMTPKFGCGLETFLQKRAEKVFGIVNGIDMDEWNPETDPLITQNFNLTDLAKRAENKKTLLAQYFPGSTIDDPLLIWVGRLTQQKGADILLDSLSEILDKKWRCIILGTGDPALEAAIAKLAEKHPQKIVGITKFSNEIAHQLYAGGDMIIMPSQYEPCGLSQMFAMRYGCLAAATSTGGLKDTIAHISSSEKPDGFLFSNPNVKECKAALELAIDTYINEPEQWLQMKKNAMQKDFSWHRSAEKYKDLYIELMESHK